MKLNETEHCRLLTRIKAKQINGQHQRDDGGCFCEEQNRLTTIRWTASGWRVPLACFWIASASVCSAVSVSIEAVVFIFSGVYHFHCAVDGDGREPAIVIFKDKKWFYCFNCKVELDLPERISKVTFFSENIWSTNIISIKFNCPLPMLELAKLQLNVVLFCFSWMTVHELLSQEDSGDIFNTIFLSVKFKRKKILILYNW
jgi:hypothetical protein